MRAARFCSECGERLKVARWRSLPFRAFCANCSPRFNRGRLMLIAASAVFVIVGFVIGHYTSKPSEPFQFIGTPIESRASQVPTANDDSTARPTRERDAVAHPEQLLISPSSADNTCGARTKSGKPCQRKVKGGGYCWQHRDQTPHRQ
jgi:hypothetical protein